MLYIFRSNLATAANDTLDEGKKFSQTALLKQTVGSKAILQRTQYHERYAENLKWELPRILLLKDRAAFDTCGVYLQTVIGGY
jgi:hypothetical protein